MTTQVKELVSVDGQFKAVVEHRDDGTYEVTLWRWMREVVPDYGEVCEPYWSQINRGVTLTDSAENAETLAREKLSEVGATELR